MQLNQKKVYPFITLSAALIMAGSTLATAQDRVVGDGNTTTVTRNPGNFTSVNSHGSLDVILIQGSTPAVKIVGEDNIIPEVVTDVNGEALDIGTKKGVELNFHKDLKIYVTVPQLKGINLGGSGDISSQGELQSDDLDVSLSGSGDIKLKVSGNQLKGSIAGSGDLTLDMSLKGDFDGSVTGSGDLDVKGSADQAKLTITGSGDIKARGLSAKGWQTAVLGSGDINR